MKTKIKNTLLATPILIASNSYAMENYNFDSFTLSKTNTLIDGIELDGYSGKMTKVFDYKEDEFLSKFYLTSEIQVFDGDLNSNNIKSNQYTLTIGYHDYIIQDLIGYTSIGISYNNLKPRMNSFEASFDNFEIRYDKKNLFLQGGVKYFFLDDDFELDFNISTNKQDNNIFYKTETQVHHNFKNGIAIGIGTNYSDNDGIKEKKYSLNFRLQQ